MEKQLLAMMTAALAALLGGQSQCAFALQAVYNFSPVNQFDISLTVAHRNPTIAHVSEKSGLKPHLKIGGTSADTTGYVLVRELAFAGPEAFVVYKEPCAHWLSINGDAKVVFAGNQNASFAQLFSGKEAASDANSQLLDGYTRREGKKFRVPWSSEAFQDLALMASSKVPQADVRKVANAFMDLHNDSKGCDSLHQTSKEVGLHPGAYFVAASAADYASFRHSHQSSPVFLHGNKAAT